MSKIGDILLGYQTKAKDEMGVWAGGVTNNLTRLAGEINAEVRFEGLGAEEGRKATLTLGNETIVMRQRWHGGENSGDWWWVIDSNPPAKEDKRKVLPGLELTVTLPDGSKATKITSKLYTHVCAVRMTDLVTGAVGAWFAEWCMSSEEAEMRANFWQHGRLDVRNGYITIEAKVIKLGELRL